MPFASPAINGRQHLRSQAEERPLAAEASPVHVVPRSSLNEEDFKRKIIHDILGHLDYRSAEENGAVEVRTEEIAQDLERLSARTLLAWYEAFLLVRSEMTYGGYELDGLRIIDNPAEVLRKLAKSDPEFDLRQYIF